VMKYGVMFLLLVCLSAVASASQLPSLNWTPRSDWINVKTDVTPAAIGDGVTDDTAAIQAALDRPGNGTTVYFPPGTYKVSIMLWLKSTPSHCFVNLVGSGRDSVLAWYGSRGGTLLLDDSNPYALYQGLVFDGRGLAAQAFRHHNTTRFETSVRYKSVAFTNFTGDAVDAPIVPRSGEDKHSTYALAEVSFENCIFDHCGTGVSIVGFNDYDYTLAGCDFNACGSGVECGHGNFYIRDCAFSGSKIADIRGNPEHGSSVRRCVSRGSAQFIDYASSVAPLVVQDCLVSGWTGSNGAIAHNGAPLLVFDCRFENPPDAKSPVECANTDKVIASSNSCSTPVAPISGVTPYNIPAGQIPPSVGVAGDKLASFVTEAIPAPETVFDARRDFHATGDGRTDDTAAIQKTIDAAAAHGPGAVAYLPLGIYAITSTLQIKEGQFILAGSGAGTRLAWRSPAHEPLISIVDPRGLVVRNLYVGHGDDGAQANSADIEQTCTHGPSRITYDGVYVYGKYARQPLTKGLLLEGLSKECVVVLNMVEGNLRVDNSADATILVNTSYEGAVTVDGANAARGGFLGFQSRLNTNCPYGVFVHHSNNLVMSDWYSEQNDNGVSADGEAGDPRGRITIEAAKANFGAGADDHLISINNYHGAILYGPSQLYGAPDVQTINQSGDQPLSIVLLGVELYNNRLAFAATGDAHLEALGCNSTGTGSAPPDSVSAVSGIAAGLDDLRRLDQLDLSLNFPFVSIH